MTELIDQSIARQFDHLPPHSIESEQCTVGSVLRDPSVLPDIRAIVGIGEAFFQADHGVIWKVVCEMSDRAKPITAILLRDELARRQLLEEVGGNSYIGELFNTMPSGGMGVHYAKVVLEKYKLRCLIETSNDALRAAYAPTDEDNADDLCAEFSRRAEAIVDRGTQETIQTLAQVADLLLEEKAAGINDRMETGLPELDDVTGGLPIGGYTIVAADGGIGKSQLCKQIARNRAGAGVPCGIIAAEESARKIVCNYFAGISGIENSKIVRNTLNGEDFSKLYETLPKIQSLPIFIDDAQRKLSRVESCIRRMVKKYRCRLIVVDHLHLLDGEAAKNQNRTQEVDKISKALKSTFKELNVVGIVAAQVNRSGNPSEAPSLSQLRDSGSLVADGDVILQLRRMDWHRWKDNPDFQPDHKLEIFVNKNKDGPMGMREFYFDGDRQTITDWNNGSGPYAPEVMF